MSLLTIIKNFCQRQLLPEPATVMGTTDQQILQVKALLEEEGMDLGKRGIWERMVYEASLTTVATESQGAITTIATNGFSFIRNQTIWDRTSRLPIVGPIGSSEWQGIKAVITSGPRFQFRIRGGNLLINPVPPAGLSWFFEYVSKNWILGADLVTFKQYFTLDTDEVLFPEELALLGLRWRWKKEKGLEYAEDMRTYEMQVVDAIGRDGMKPILEMDRQVHQHKRPGIFIPQGNWVP